MKEKIKNLSQRGNIENLFSLSVIILSWVIGQNTWENLGPSPILFLTLTSLLVESLLLIFLGLVILGEVYSIISRYEGKTIRPFSMVLLAKDNSEEEFLKFKNFYIGFSALIISIYVLPLTVFILAVFLIALPFLIYIFALIFLTLFALLLPVIIIVFIVKEVNKKDN